MSTPITCLTFCRYAMAVADPRRNHRGVTVRGVPGREWFDRSAAEVHRTAGDRANHHSGRPGSVRRRRRLRRQELVHRTRVSAA